MHINGVIAIPKFYKQTNNPKLLPYVYGYVIYNTPLHTVVNDKAYDNPNNNNPSNGDYNNTKICAQIAIKPEKIVYI